MSDLNLQINFNGETQFMNIPNTSSLKFFCNMIREIFEKNNPQISCKKLIIFNGIPVKKIFEHDTEQNITLANLKIYNNSLLRIDIDEDNNFTESYMQNTENIKAQQKELDKYAENKKSFDNSNAFAESNNSCFNVSKNLSDLSYNAKNDEKKEEELFGKNKIARKIIPADNSCLFTSINYSYYGTMGDPMIMRELIAAQILGEPNFFNEAILEKHPDDYCAWILDKNSWGGGIELSIIPSILNIKIGVVSIKDLNIEYFGENYENVIFALYNGIHYDSIVRITDNGEVGVFPCSNKSLEEDLIEMAKYLRSKSDFVDMKNYKLKCDVCYKPLEGNTDAVQHSKETGHVNFVQFG